MQRKILQNKSNYKYAKIIYVGNSMDLVNKIFNAKKGALKKIFGSRQNYEHIFFVDTSNSASQQLKYLINTTHRNKMRTFIDNSFGGELESLYITHTKDRKTEIMDCTGCDLMAIHLYKTEDEKLPEVVKNLTVVCVDYQLPYMEKYFIRRSSVEHCQILSEEIYGTEDTR